MNAVDGRGGWKTRLRRLLPVLVVIAIGAAAAGPATVDAHHVLDDPYVLANARSPDLRQRLFAYSVDCPGPRCTTPWWVAPPYRRHFLRLAPSLLLSAGVAIAGPSRASLHLLCGLAIHLANALLLLALLLRFDVGRGLATLCASLFAAHPAGAEIAGTASFVCVPVAAAFALLALLAWQRHRASGGGRWAVLCGAACLAAMTSYEAAVLLPLVIAIADHTLHRDRFRWSSPFVVALGALLPLFFLVRFALGTRDLARPFGVLLGSGMRLGAKECVGYGLELFSLLRWDTLSPDWLYDTVGEIGAILIALTATLAILAWARRRPLARVGAILFVAFLLPPVAVRATVGVFNHPTMRQIYLPLVGAALVVAAIRPRSLRLGWLVVCVFALYSWQLAATTRRPPSQISAQVRRALSDVDPQIPVAWIGQPPSYHVEYDWPGREQWLLIPPPLSDGALQLCTGDSPHALRAIATAGFSGKHRPGDARQVDFLSALWREPTLFSDGNLQLPFARIEIPPHSPDPPTELRFELARDVVFLRYARGAVTRVQPVRCDHSLSDGSSKLPSNR